MAQTTLEGAAFHQEIMERGYAEFEHGIPQEEIENIVWQYGRFTVNHPDPQPATMDAILPEGDDPQIIGKVLDVLDYSKDKQKEWHKYRTNVPAIGKSNGYTNRSFQVDALRRARGLYLPEEDPKEFYHFMPSHFVGIAKAHEEYGWGPIPQEVNMLNNAFAPVHRKILEMMMRVCSIIEERDPRVTKYMTPEALALSPLRLLFYHPTLKPTLAAAHHDKGFLTGQIAESHTGLQVAPSDEEPLQPVIRDANEAVIFPAWGIEQNMPELGYKSGWHAAENDGDLNPGQSEIPDFAKEICARWVLVWFTNGMQYENPDKALMHNR